MKRRLRRRCVAGAGRVPYGPGVNWREREGPRATPADARDALAGGPGAGGGGTSLPGVAGRAVDGPGPRVEDPRPKAARRSNRRLTPRRRR